MVEQKAEKKYLFIFFFICFFTVALDQLTKYLIAALNPSWFFGFMGIHFVHNTGAGFGILKGQMGILAFISALVALTVLFFYNRIPKEKIPQVLFALFFGGVAGNLIDRLLRGYVVDLIDVSFWPVFNLADAAISVSVIGLVLYYWKK